MKQQVVILCGGDGTRMLPENERDARKYPETEDFPKPMITIGNKPILWHIMKKCSKNGYKRFLLLIGYKRKIIIDYFKNPAHKESDWEIEFSNAGRGASKGERIRKAFKDGKIKFDEDGDIFLCYGDDLCSIDMDKVMKKHKLNKKLVTLTSVRPFSNFGVITFNGDDGTVKEFKEKPQLTFWINGGYIAINKKAINYIIKIDGDETDAFELLAKRRKVQVVKYSGFWKTMNTIKDMIELRKMWGNGELQKELKIYDS
jgi:glucose-1-phosphate cytidylyltransferase